jgi:hypothetical protein
LARGQAAVRSERTPARGQPPRGWEMRRED